MRPTWKEECQILRVMKQVARHFHARFPLADRGSSILNLGSSWELIEFLVPL